MRPAEPGREAILALEGHAAREQPEHDAAERVEIGRRAGHHACGLLGRPVLGCPGEHAGYRRGPGRPRQSGETEIRDDDASGPALDEHVGRCQVAVDDTAAVRVRERRCDRPTVRPGLVPAERAPRDQRVERDAFDELQDEHGLSLVLEHVVEADDVRMLKPCQRRRLALEPLAQLRVVCDPGVEDLERDVALEPLVAGPPDDAHAAATELLEDSIAVGDGRLCSLHADPTRRSGQLGRLTQPRSENVKALLHRP